MQQAGIMGSFVKTEIGQKEQNEGQEQVYNVTQPSAQT